MENQVQVKNVAVSVKTQEINGQQVEILHIAVPLTPYVNAKGVEVGCWVEQNDKSKKEFVNYARVGDRFGKQTLDLGNLLPVLKGFRFKMWLGHPVESAQVKPMEQPEQVNLTEELFGGTATQNPAQSQGGQNGASPQTGPRVIKGGKQ